MVYATISGFSFHLQLEILRPTDTHAKTMSKNRVPVTKVGVLEKEKSNSVGWKKCYFKSTTHEILAFDDTKKAL